MKKSYIIGLVVLAIVGVFLFSAGGITGNVVSAEMVDGGDFVKIDTLGITKTAQFYEYDGIEFFVVKTKSGIVKAAFNACDVCYKSRKGYRQEGEDMVCNNCGNHYAISGLGTANLRGGGCWPGYLETGIEGDDLIITKLALEKGRYRFS